MIRGDAVEGLARYLYGPGNDEEHQNPRLVASWSGREIDPASAGEAGLRRLIDLMNQPLRLRELSLGSPVNNPVWHFPVRAAPTDPILTDRQWNIIARRVVAAAGIAPDADLGACRWIAVRHADDHVHIVATLARSDGGRVDHHNDALRARAELRRIEQDFGLRATAPADRTAPRHPTRKEAEKALRHGQHLPARERLEKIVRDVAITASTEREFFALLESNGLHIRQRLDDVGDLVGYAVALPGDRDRAGEPIWYSGSKLARDLSLPKVRARLRAHDVAADRRAPHPGHQPDRQPDRPPASPAEAAIEQRAEAWHQAAAAMALAAAALPDADDAEADAILESMSDVLTAAAENAPAPVRDELQAAARDFRRAAQVPGTQQDDQDDTDSASEDKAAKAQRHARQAADDLRLAARAVMAGGRAFASGQDMAAVFQFTIAAIAAVRATYHWFRGRGADVQADAAQDASAHLRAAAGLRTTNLTKTLPYDSVAAQNPQLQQAARAALSDHGINPEAVLKEPAWPALAAVLRQLEAAGYPADIVMRQVVAERSLDDARSVAEVLAWRAQRWQARHPAPTRSTPPPEARTSPAPVPPQQAPAEQDAQAPPEAPDAREQDSAAPVDEEEPDFERWEPPLAWTAEQWRKTREPDEPLTQEPGPTPDTGAPPHEGDLPADPAPTATAEQEEPQEPDIAPEQPWNLWEIEPEAVEHYAQMLRTHSETEAADTMVGDLFWPAVAEVLQEAEAAGYSAAEALTATDACRPGDTTLSLAWRVREYLADEQTRAAAPQAPTDELEPQPGQRPSTGPRSQTPRHRGLS